MKTMRLYHIFSNNTIRLKACILFGILTFAFLGCQQGGTSTDTDSVSFSIVDDGTRAIMRGTIGQDFTDKVTALIEANPKLKTIEMVDVPGSQDDGEAWSKAARKIREARLNTHVPANGYIASGGVDVFCAGVQRTVAEGGRLGVHAWAGDDVENANDLPRDDPRHQRYLIYYREMGIPENFYWFTLKAAAPNDIHIMSRDELQEHQLITGSSQ